MKHTPGMLTGSISSTIPPNTIPQSRSTQRGTQFRSQIRIEPCINSTTGPRRSGGRGGQGP